MTINVSLTQFIHFKAAVSTKARITAVKQIKDYIYSPATDYWRDLRNAINQYSKNEITLDELRNVSTVVKQKKRANYSKAVNKFINYLSKHNISFFQVDRSTWSYKDLVISATPELGMVIDGKPFLVKNFYNVKKPSERVIQKNIMPSLALLEIANKAKENNQSVGILNLQNGKLLTPKADQLPDPLELELDAQTLLDYWNRL